MKNWELVIINRISGNLRKKKNRIVFAATEKSAEERGKRVYKDSLNFFQRLLYRYEIR